jgi:hypothetical protein
MPHYCGPGACSSTPLAETPRPSRRRSQVRDCLGLRASRLNLSIRGENSSERSERIGKGVGNGRRRADRSSFAHPERPRVVITTTPKPIKIIRELIADPITVITRGSTYDNRASLAPAVGVGTRAGWPLGARESSGCGVTCAN